MNKIVIGTICLLIGGGAGFLFGRKRASEHYSNYYEDLLDAMKEWYECELEKQSDQECQMDKIIAFDKNYAPDPEESLQDPNLIRKVEAEHELLAKKKQVNNTYETAKKDYHLMRKIEETTDDLNEIIEEPISYGRDLADVDRTKPYHISVDEFDTEFTDINEKEELYYYLEDGVLCHDDDVPVSFDIDEQIGVDNLSPLNTSICTWIRNEPLCVDYCIIGVKGSYARHVLSNVEEDESPKERYARMKKEGEVNGK